MKITQDIHKAAAEALAEQPVTIPRAHLEAYKTADKLEKLNKANADGWAEAVKLNWQALTERDAIRAKTIEECATIADRESQTVDGGEYWIAARIAERIRALSQPASEDEKE